MCANDFIRLPFLMHTGDIIQTNKKKKLIYRSGRFNDLTGEEEERENRHALNTFITEKRKKEKNIKNTE